MSLDQLLALQCSCSRATVVTVISVRRLTLALATVGLYSIVFYSVSQRQHEDAFRWRWCTTGSLHEGSVSLDVLAAATPYRCRISVQRRAHFAVRRHCWFQPWSSRGPGRPIHRARHRLPCGEAVDPYERARNGAALNPAGDRGRHPFLA